MNEVIIPALFSGATSGFTECAINAIVEFFRKKNSAKKTEISHTEIRHYVDDIYVPADQYVAYTFYVQNQGIPEYHGKYNYRWHTSTHWEKAAG